MKKGLKKLAAAVLTAVMLVTQLPVVEGKAAGTTGLSGKAHVQTYGDKNGRVVTEDGIETLVLGTRGQAKRVESVTINLQNGTGYTGSIEYRVHRQTYGWTDWLQAGKAAGTTGQGKRLEAIQIRLTGELAKHYDVRYRVHIQTYGDNQGWMYNGALAGTTGEAKRLEEVRVQIIPKNTQTETPDVTYRVHRQTYGWETTWAKNGSVSGTTGQGKRLEGISIDIKGSSYSGSIRYKTHVQSYGWMAPVEDGEMSGTSGQAKRLEAVKIWLTGELAEHYDIYYRVHAQTFGWMGWTKNGEAAGTAGYAKRLEAIQIVLVKKGAAAPSASYKGVTQTSSAAYRDAGNSTGSTAGGGSQNAVWIPEKTQTVEYWQCDYCKHKFRTEEEMKQHFAYWNREYVFCKCADGNGSKKTETYFLRSGYWSNEAAPEEQEVVWVAIEPAHTDTFEVIEYFDYAICNGCKKRFYDDEYVHGDPETDPGAHMGSYAHTNPAGHPSYSTGFKEKRIIGYETLTEPEYGYYSVK